MSTCEHAPVDALSTIMKRVIETHALVQLTIRMNNLCIKAALIERTKVGWTLQAIKLYILYLLTYKHVRLKLNLLSFILLVSLFQSYFMPKLAWYKSISLNTLLILLGSFGNPTLISKLDITSWRHFPLGRIRLNVVELIALLAFWYVWSMSCSKLYTVWTIPRTRISSI